MDLSTVRKTYNRYAKSYDVLFGAVFELGRRKLFKSLKLKTGERVLEVGVGTGLSLRHYPEGVRVVGIDISEEMLAKARKKVAKHRLTHVENLLVMDAESLEFPDHSFDRVIALYVASVVPNPQRLVSEVKRVCKPGGMIYFLNHFESESCVLRTCEKALSPFADKLGFRPDVNLDQFLKSCQLESAEVRPANLFGFWRLISFRNDKPQLH